MSADHHEVLRALRFLLSAHAGKVPLGVALNRAEAAVQSAMLDAAPGAPAAEEEVVTDAEMVKWLTDNGHEVGESLLAAMEKSK